MRASLLSLLVLAFGAVTLWLLGSAVLHVLHGVAAALAAAGG